MKTPKIPHTDSLTELARFWDTHDLTDFEEEFSRFTGVAPNRAAGQTYGGRTLIYEDCRRDLEAKIGPAVLESLAPPLSLLLRSGRWRPSDSARWSSRSWSGGGTGQATDRELTDRRGTRAGEEGDEWRSSSSRCSW